MAAFRGHFSLLLKLVSYNPLHIARLVENHLNIDLAA